MLKQMKRVKSYSGTDEDIIKKFYVDYCFEYLAVNEKTLGFLFKNADIS